MKHVYKTQNTCAKNIIIDIDNNGIVNDITFIGGCPGNLSALSKMLCGNTPAEIIAICEGNTCGNKGTSCLDQLAQALKSLD